MVWRTASISFHGFHSSSSSYSIFMRVTIFLFFRACTTLPVSLLQKQWLGVVIVAGPGPRRGAQGALMSVYCRDPDGSLIEIASYLEG
jgi:hypothetical protein